MISLASEMTDSKGRHARGWLFFDADCEFCRQLADWLAPRMRHRGLATAPLQDPRVGALLGISREESLRALRFVTNEAQYLAADAVLAIAREFWWGRPLVWMSRIPGARPMLRAAYDWQAGRRRCQGHLRTP